MSLSEPAPLAHYQAITDKFKKAIQSGDTELAGKLDREVAEQFDWFFASMPDNRADTLDLIVFFLDQAVVFGAESEFAEALKRKTMELIENLNGM